MSTNFHNFADSELVVNNNAGPRDGKAESQGDLGFFYLKFSNSVGS